MSANFGKTFDSSVIEQGLRELNRDFHFDAATKHGAWHPYQDSRQGVFYHGQHLCSMDRGIVPEYKQWGVSSPRKMEVPWSEADKDDVTVEFRTLDPTMEGYEDLLEVARKGKDPRYVLRADGILCEYKPMAIRQVPARVVLVGWRHTFERILQRDIPGVTRQSLSEKFGVDMLKYPEGPPEEVLAALMEE